MLQPPTFEGQILLHEDERRQGSANPVPPRVHQRIEQGLSYCIWGVTRWPSLPHCRGRTRWGIESRRGPIFCAVLICVIWLLTISMLSFCRSTRFSLTLSSDQPGGFGNRSQSGGFCKRREWSSQSRSQNLKVQSHPEVICRPEARDQS